MQITGDLSLDQFQTLVNSEGYPKLSDYLHTAFPGTKFITVGEKSYAVDSATAGTGDIGVRLSSRQSNVTARLPDRMHEPGRTLRSPVGRNVPAYLTAPDAIDPTTCGRFFINSDKTNDYGTVSTYPGLALPGRRQPIRPRSDPSALGRPHRWRHLGRRRRDGHDGERGLVGHVRHARWHRQGRAHVGRRPGHRWSRLLGRTTGQVHVDCMAQNADAQLGRMLDTAGAASGSSTRRSSCSRPTTGPRTRPRATSTGRRRRAPATPTGTGRRTASGTPVCSTR